MQMGAPMDQNGMMYQQQQYNQMQPGQQFNGGMYTNQFMPQGGFGGPGPQMSMPG